MGEDEIVNMSFRVTRRRQGELKAAAWRLRTSVQRMLLQGVDLLLSKNDNNIALETKESGRLGRSNPKKDRAIQRVIVACEQLVELADEHRTDTAPKGDHAREAIDLLTRAKAHKASRPATRKRPRKGGGR